MVETSEEALPEIQWHMVAPHSAGRRGWKKVWILVHIEGRPKGFADRWMWHIGQREESGRPQGSEFEKQE